MRAAMLALLVLVLGSPQLAAAEAPSPAAADDASAANAKAPKDPWLGCWAKVYDAAHLTKHPGQLVTALTLAVDPRTPKDETDPGAYRARIAASFRGKTDNFTGPEDARCAPVSPTADKMHCFVDGVFLGQFWLERAGKNMKLAMPDTDDELVLVPGVELSAFVRLTPANPEHALFLLTPATATACGQ
jgi:hypothetical protein